MLGLWCLLWNRTKLHLLYSNNKCVQLKLQFSWEPSRVNFFLLLSISRKLLVSSMFVEIPGHLESEIRTTFRLFYPIYTLLFFYAFSWGVVKNVVWHDLLWLRCRLMTCWVTAAASSSVHYKYSSRKCQSSPVTDTNQRGPSVFVPKTNVFRDQCRKLRH